MLPDEPDADTLAKLYAFEPSSPFVQNSMQEFISKTEFTPDNFYNYDPYDLFYWEYKMGSWLTLWLLELDMVHEKISFFNNRTLLKLLLSVDYEHRREKDLFYRLIDHLWPKCLDIEVNPHKEPKVQGMDKMKRLFGGLLVRQPVPVYDGVLDAKRKLI